jgi:hypothetical protein
VGCIRAHVAAHDTEEARQAMEALTVDNILSPGNLREARKQIKKGTVGGGGRLRHGVLRRPGGGEGARDSHLEILYREVREDKRMPASMRNARLSMLHKGKGRSPMLPKNYRPVAVTNTAYRVLMKAVQLKLAPATTAVVSPSVGGLGVPTRGWEPGRAKTRGPLVRRHLFFPVKLAVGLSLAPSTTLVLRNLSIYRIID